MKRLSVLILVFASIISLARGANAQWRPGDPPVIDMGRLYQIVGYMYHVDPDLLEAIASVESNGDPSAVSPKGAQGVMQLMPGTSQQFRVNNPFDPVDNVLGAARFLDSLRTWAQFQAPFEVGLPDIIAAYNAGPGAIKKYKGIPPYAETQAYVRKVLLTYLLGEPLKHRNPAPVIVPAAAAAYAPPGAPAIMPASTRPITVHVRPKKLRSRDTPLVLRSGGDGSLLSQLADIKRRREHALAREAHNRTAQDVQAPSPDASNLVH